MSTTFGILKAEPLEVKKYMANFTKEEICHMFREEMFDKIAFRSRTVRSLDNKDWLINSLPGDTPVFALDNTQQGIETIDDLRKEIMEDCS